MKKRVLIIDDDMDMCTLLSRFLTRNGYEVDVAYSGQKGIVKFEEQHFDAVLCDFRLGSMDGKEVLLSVKKIRPSAIVLIITGYSDIKTAIDVIKQGAFDYITKPLIPDEVLSVLNKALEAGEAGETGPTQSAGISNVAARQKLAPSKYQKQKFLVGEAPATKDLYRQIEIVAPTNYSIIIYGESGSGKEVIAQEIHKRSRRNNKPFIAIDCGTLSRELAGSELFGHEKGSFTGAIGQKAGSFELANGGTIFLDEIANLPYDVQVSLLRVTQERKMRRVGGTKDIDLDVRIIVASNKKLWDSARTGQFREDLYHRFNEFQINVPPLRERVNDIMVFANHFLMQTNRELGKNVKRFSPEVEDVFRKYIWHGNLRELKNVVKRATLLADSSVIDIKSIPFELVNYRKLQFENATESVASVVASEAVSPTNQQPVTVREPGLKSVSIDAEYEWILETLKKVDFNKSKAAKLLKIDRKTLYNKIKQYKDLNNQEL